METARLIWYLTKDLPEDAQRRILDFVTHEHAKAHEERTGPLLDFARLLGAELDGTPE
jgi:hypothetical protein